jgi:hypothetical protein
MDAVHPHWAGHTVMAYAFMKAMGLNGDIGTFTVDLKKNKIKISEGHKVIPVKDGEYEIESFRHPFCPCEPDGHATASYPVCGKDNVTSDNSIGSGMTFVPFNQELNRLMLIVKNCTANPYQVSWGDESKAFANVDAAVAARQAYEITEIKKLFRGTDSRMSMEQIVAQTDKVVGETEKQHDALVAAIHSSFGTVTHMIKIMAQ